MRLMMTKTRFLIFFLSFLASASAHAMNNFWESELKSQIMSGSGSELTLIFHNGKPVNTMLPADILCFLGPDADPVPGLENDTELTPIKILIDVAKKESVYGAQRILNTTCQDAQHKSYGVTPLLAAIIRGNVKNVEILLAAGADPNLQGLQEYQKSPIIAAIEGFCKHPTDNRRQIITILTATRPIITPGDKAVMQRALQDQFQITRCGFPNIVDVKKVSLPDNLRFVLAQSTAEQQVIDQINPQSASATQDNNGHRSRDDKRNAFLAVGCVCAIFVTGYWLYCYFNNQKKIAENENEDNVHENSKSNE